MHIFHSLKWIWKHHLRNGGHFVKGEIIDRWVSGCFITIRSTTIWCCVVCLQRSANEYLCYRDMCLNTMYFHGTFTWEKRLTTHLTHCDVITPWEYTVGFDHGLPWASYQIRKIAGAHAPGMPGTFSLPPWVSDPDMHHGTCVTHVPWCMSGSLTSGFLWSRRRGKTFLAFPAHAQPAILRIWQEAHAMWKTRPRGLSSRYSGPRKPWSNPIIAGSLIDFLFSFCSQKYEF